MRTASRNKRTIWFANFLGKKPIQGSAGKFLSSYTEPMKLRVNISPNRGDVALRVFGEMLEYDRTILFSGNSPLTEQSIIWLDCLIAGKIPQINGENVPHDYIVKRVAESLPSTGHTVIAVKKINVQFSRALIMPWGRCAPCKTCCTSTKFTT